MSKTRVTRPPASAGQSTAQKWHGARATAKRPAKRSPAEARHLEQVERHRILRRENRLMREIARQTRRLRHLVETVDSELLSTARWLAQRAGADELAQMLTIRALLDAAGQLRHDESIYGAVRRILESAQNAARAIDAALGDPAELTYDATDTQEREPARAV